MNTKKVKARKMWQTASSTPEMMVLIDKPFSFGSFFVLPATAEAYDAMHAQFWNACLRRYDAGASMNDAVHAGFSVIGIKPPRPAQDGGDKRGGEP